MKSLFDAGKLLLLDMASTFFFLVVYLLTGNITLSVLLAMALGAAQIGWQIARRQPIDTMQWMSLFLVLGAGTVTLITDDPRFVMVKPSVIYVIVGIVMLKPGWINRYLPPVAKEFVPDIAVIFGYAWAGLMFFSAAPEPGGGAELQRGDVVGIDVDLCHRQQGGAVPDRLRHHADHDHPPPPCPDAAGGFLRHCR
jgi:intracellular septation protein